MTKKKRYLLYCSEKYAVGIMRSIHSEIMRRQCEVAWFFDGPGRELLNDSDKVLQTITDVVSFGADAVILPGDRVPHFIPGVKVEIFHGFDAGKPRHIHIRGLFDIYCTTGPDMTAAFTEKQRQDNHFAVYETGWAKLDYFNRSDTCSRSAKDEQPIFKDDRPVILYHSTFSPRWSAAPYLFETIKKLSLKTDWNWLISFHPKMDLGLVEQFKGIQKNNLVFCEGDNILKIQKQADVMVSDTSSAILEFVMQEKPVVTFNNRAPKPYMINIDRPEKLESSIELALTQPDNIKQEILRVKAASHPYSDGQSCRRVLDAIDDFIDNGRATYLKSKPLNIWRKIKLRKKFGYWKFT